MRCKQGRGVRKIPLMSPKCDKGGEGSKEVMTEQCARGERGGKHEHKRGKRAKARDMDQQDGDDERR